MPGRPAPDLSSPSPPTPDRTSTIVRVGLLVLLLIGVASIFGDGLLGLITHPDPR